MSKKKTETKVAVEINEEDLDQASGGAVDTFRVGTTAPTTDPGADKSLNFSQDIHFRKAGGDPQP